MATNELKTKAKKEFDSAVSLMSIIPLLTFFYLLIGKLASLSILKGEVGYIMLIVAVLIMLGITTGKKIIWLLINRLLEFSQKIINMEKELMDKGRMAAISETVLSISHEINNPLLVMQGNIALLEGSLKDGQLAPEQLQERFGQIKNNCERIMSLTQKLSTLNNTASLTIHEEIKMIDLNRNNNEISC